MVATSATSAAEIWANYIFYIFGSGKQNTMLFFSLEMCCRQMKYIWGSGHEKNEQDFMKGKACKSFSTEVDMFWWKCVCKWQRKHGVNTERRCWRTPAEIILRQIRQSTGPKHVLIQTF